MQVRIPLFAIFRGNGRSGASLNRKSILSLRLAYTEDNTMNATHKNITKLI